jgi:hypothetical protein
VGTGRFSTDNILDASEDNSFGRMVIDKNGTKWMATNRDGVVILAIIRSKKLCTTKEICQLQMLGFAIDNRNQL